MQSQRSQMLHELFLKSARFCSTVALACVVSVGACEGSKLKVGLFSDSKSTDKKSREAAWNLLQTVPDMQVDRVTTETVLKDAARYDVLIFPGGTANGEAKAIGVEGGKALERYVSSGHGLIGICAGGYLIVEGWNPPTQAVEVLKAESWDDEHWARGEGMISVKLVGKSDQNSSATMWFENGPIFVPGKKDSVTSYTPLVRYVTDYAAKGAPKGMMTGRDAVIAGTFGKGRAIAFGPHPELSPDLKHWLPNAIRWAASGDDGSSITVGRVLEGAKQ